MSDTVDIRTVFLLGLESGDLAAAHAYVDLVAQLNDPVLPHVAPSKVREAEKPLKEALAAARAKGLSISEPPTKTAEWPAWRDELRRQGGRAAELGLLAGALEEAWAHAAFVADARLDKPDHPILVEQAQAAVVTTARAYEQLRAALAKVERVVVTNRLPHLATIVKDAPPADAVKSLGYRTNSSHIINWRAQHLAWLLRHLALMLAVPPPAPNDREEVYRLQREPCERGGPNHMRSRQLIELHPEWTQPLIDLGAREIDFRGGDPFELTIDIDPFLANATKLFALAPLRFIHLKGGAGKHAAQLAKVPELANLIALDLTEQGFDDEAIAHLMRSPHLSRLERLTLNQNRLTNAGVDLIAAASKLTLTSIKQIGLNLNPCPDPNDELLLVDEHNRESFPTERGKELEAKFGPLPWLH